MSSGPGAHERARATTYRANVRTGGPRCPISDEPGELFRGTAAERSVLGEFCRATSQARPLLGGRHLISNREPTCWDHHERMGMKKALPKECLVEMQNPHRWIAPRGAAARPEGLEPPTF